MGEWIRHRGSKSMPKRLEGMRFEAKMRDGEVREMDSEVIGIRHPESWANEGWHYEVVKYRILGPIVDQKLPDTDGWIEWHGGECPVAEGALVDVKFRNGRIENGTPAGEYNGSYSRMQAIDWSHNRFQSDIIAYRLSKPDWPENRIDVIGQNGNTGEHYNEVKMMNGKVELIPTPERIAFLKENAASAEVAFDRGKPNKYQRTIKGVTVDVYDVLVAFGVTCPAMAHAIKKMLMPGQRGSKDAEQDKREAIQAIERSIELHN